MTEISIAWPIAAGREEEWRRFLQELAGSRSGDFDRTRRRLGIGAVRVWLQRTRRGRAWCGELSLVYVEVEDLTEALSALASSEGGFERWFKRRIQEFYGVDLALARTDAAAELVFSSGPEKRA